MSKYIKRFLGRDNGSSYQSRVGQWPKYEFLTKNSIELANFLNKNKLLKDSVNIFEIGSGGCRNLKYINDLNENVNLFANDLNKVSSFKHMHESVKEKVTFYEKDTLSLVRETELEFDIDILISSDHLMHVDEESVIEIIKIIKTKWKPKYILLRELFSKDGHKPDRVWPRMYHDYELEDFYKLIDVGECSNKPEWYSLKLYKLNKDWWNE